MKHVYMLSGLVIVSALIFSYFITIPVDSGSNYVTNDRLLGIIIFHNPFILGLYALLGLVLIVKGVFFKDRR